MDSREIMDDSYKLIYHLGVLIYLPYFDLRESADSSKLYASLNIRGSPQHIVSPYSPAHDCWHLREPKIPLDNFTILNYFLIIVSPQFLFKPTA
jgi:hypothetical protein